MLTVPWNAQCTSCHSTDWILFLCAIALLYVNQFDIKIQLHTYFDSFMASCLRLHVLRKYQMIDWPGVCFYLKSTDEWNCVRRQIISLWKKHKKGARVFAIDWSQCLPGNWTSESDLKRRINSMAANKNIKLLQHSIRMVKYPFISGISLSPANGIFFKRHSRKFFRKPLQEHFFMWIRFIFGNCKGKSICLE